MTTGLHRPEHKKPETNEDTPTRQVPPRARRRGESDVRPDDRPLGARRRLRHAVRPVSGRLAYHTRKRPRPAHRLPHLGEGGRHDDLAGHDILPAKKVRGVRHHPCAPSRPDGLPGAVPFRLQGQGGAALAQRHREAEDTAQTLPPLAGVAAGTRRPYRGDDPRLYGGIPLPRPRAAQDRLSAHRRRPGRSRPGSC